MANKHCVGEFKLCMFCVLLYYTITVKQVLDTVACSTAMPLIWDSDLQLLEVMQSVPHLLYVHYK